MGFGVAVGVGASVAVASGSRVAKGFKDSAIAASTVAGTSGVAVGATWEHPIAQINATKETSDNNWPSHETIPVASQTDLNATGRSEFLT
jgi:hypothetical protein